MKSIKSEMSGDLEDGMVAVGKCVCVLVLVYKTQDLLSNSANIFTEYY